MVDVSLEDYVALAAQGLRTKNKEDVKLRKLPAKNVITDVYVASYTDWYQYPYCLQMQSRASDAIRNDCLKYILDSGFKDDAVTNEDVIETVLDIQPDYFIGKDYPGNASRTADSLREFIELFESQESNIYGEPLLPVQPPYVETFESNQNIYAGYNKFALGGLHYFTSTEAQLRAIEEFVNTVNPGYVHALGVGTNLPFVMHLRDNPHLLDSLDISTPERAVKNNALPDSTWIQKEFEPPKGTDSTALRANLAKYVAYQLNYMLTPMFNDEEMITLQEQSTLDSFGETEEDIDLSDPTFEPGRDHVTSV